MQEDKKQQLIKKLKAISNPQGAALDEIKEKLDEQPAKMEKATNAGEFISNFLQSIKGDKGDIPQRGKDYLTEEEMADIVKQATPILGKDYLTEADIQTIKDILTPRKGEHYFTQEEIDDFIEKVTPVKGVHYNDGKPGKDAEEIDVDDIVEKVMEKIPEPKNGKPGKDADPEEVVELLKKLPEKKRLDISHLRNSTQIQSAISKMIKGGGITGVNTNKITVSATTPQDPKEGDLWVDTA